MPAFEAEAEPCPHGVPKPGLKIERNYVNRKAYKHLDGQLDQALRKESPRMRQLTYLHQYRVTVERHDRQVLRHGVQNQSLCAEAPPALALEVVMAWHPTCHDEKTQPITKVDA